MPIDFEHAKLLVNSIAHISQSAFLLRKEILS